MNIKFLFYVFIIFSTLKINAQDIDTTLNPLDTLASALTNLLDKVDKSNRLNITGYLQPQFQIIETAGANSFAGGNFGPEINNRFMMRRGRIKFTYEYGLAMFMLNTDWTEKGVNIRETYVKITDPWTEHLQLSMGMRQYLFGHDVSYSSGDRETPERARMFQILFPTERDLQAILTFQPPKTSRYAWIKADIAVANGSGVASEFDSYKDAYGRVYVNKSNNDETFKFGMGLSYLKGGYRKGQMNFNTMGKDTMYKTYTDSANLNGKAPREYFGADMQLTSDLPFGINIIRAEYIQGWQTGTSSGSVSPNFLPTSDLYLRYFNGFSIYVIQTIKQSRFQVTFKYDWYDPNINVSGTQIGVKNSKTNAGDIKYSTVGFGLNYRIVENVRVMGYYDIVKNEITSLKGYTEDIKDNVFTFRIQYKF